MLTCRWATKAGRFEWHGHIRTLALKFADAWDSRPAEDRIESHGSHGKWFDHGPVVRSTCVTLVRVALRSDGREEAVLNAQPFECPIE
jgi:hypothetical protein